MITGGSKGLGYALAHQFLSYGHKVIICNRNEDQLATALRTLQAEHEGSIVYGMCCDVSNAADVCAFASLALLTFGSTMLVWYGALTQPFKEMQRVLEALNDRKYN